MEILELSNNDFDAAIIEKLQLTNKKNRKSQQRNIQS